MSSNQDRDITGVLETVSLGDLSDLAAVLWLEVSRHPPGASCECPVIETLARLTELGYRISGVSPPAPRQVH